MLNDLNKISDPTAKFAALNVELEKLGITQELIAASANTTAVEYDKLSGAAGDALAQLGQSLGTILLPAARGITDQLTKLSTALQNLSAQGEQIVNITNAFLLSSQTVDEFNNKVANANAQLPFYAAGFTQLSTAQFEYAKNLQAIGVGNDELISRLQALQPLLNGISQIFDSTGVAANSTSTQLQKFQLAALTAASVSDQGALVAENYAVAVGQQSLSIDQATELLSVYVTSTQNASQANQQNADATNQVALATNLFTQELQANAIEALNSQIQTEALKQRQQELYNAALAAASGMGATAESAALLAQQFNITTGEAYGLISALQQLEVAKAKKTSGLNPKDFDTNAEFLAAVESAEAMDKAWEAQKAYNFAVADTAGKLKIAQGELAKTRKGTEEYWQALTKVSNLEQQYNNELERNKKKGKGGGAPKLTPNQKINNKLLTDLDKFYQKEEEAERKHLKKIEDINADHIKKMNAQIAENEVSKRRSREQFYSGLTSADGVDTSQFAAAYEQAFAKAQEIAQSGSAKLADDFLKLKQQHIEELLALEKEAADIRADEDISEQDKAAALEYLEGRRELIQDAQREEEQQLLARGDAITNETRQRLDEETAAYEEQTTKIGIAAQNAADLKIAQAERSKIAVSEENKELAKQVGLYRDVNTAAGRALADPRDIARTADATIAGDIQPITAPEPLPITTGVPIPIISPEILLVQQSTLWTVRDQGVIDSLMDQTIRLETKLDQINNTLVLGVQGISDRLDGVRNVLGNTRANTAGAL